MGGGRKKEEEETGGGKRKYEEETGEGPKSKSPKDQYMSKSNSNICLTLKKVHLVLML